MFSQISYLKQHAVVHTYDKPFKWEKCNKLFTQKYILTTHMLIYSGRNDFQCNACEKRFTQKGQTTHVVHTHKRKISSMWISQDDVFSVSWFKQTY